MKVRKLGGSQWWWYGELRGEDVVSSPTAQFKFGLSALDSCCTF